MLQAVEGIYRDGVIELLEMPQNIRESRVLVTFLSSQAEPTSNIIRFGMFAGVQQSTEEDFAIAQFQDQLDDSFKG